MKIIVCSASNKPVRLTKDEKEYLQKVSKDLKKKLGLKLKVQK